MQVSEQVREDDKATNIQKLVEKYLEHACFAKDYLTRKAGEEDLFTSADADKVKKQVLRYLQVKDKYLSLGSMLFKSQLFHTVYGNKSTSPTAVPIVELPRTESKRPYIPLRAAFQRPDNVQEENLYPFSVSHQFPFVALARHELFSGDPPTDDDIANPPHKIGIDVVTFDKINPKLYSNEQEFINVFRQSFTEWEWERINNNTTAGSPFHEFYVRWSMKEAYTKALGVGMGLAFDGFDMRTDLDNDCETGLWPIIRGNHDGISTYASIVHHGKTSDPVVTVEKWEFFFLPLKDGKNDNVNSLHAKGCLCICVGNGKIANESTKHKIRVEWTTMESLLRWHSPNIGKEYRTPP